MRTEANLESICENLRSSFGDFHAACRAAGLSVNFVSNWIRDDKEAAAQIEEAQRLGYMGLESVAITRAVHGVEKGVYFKGVKVDTERQYSDGLLIKVMETRLPAYKKGENANQTFNGPTQINIMPRAENFEEWLDMKRITLEQRAADKAAALLPSPKVPEILQGDYIELTPEQNNSLKPINPLEGLGL